jgi:hypothetical protein
MSPKKALVEKDWVVMHDSANVSVASSRDDSVGVAVKSSAI